MKFYLAFLFAGLLFLLSAKPLQAQHVFTAGPMLHYNFGGGSKGHFSFGLEVAYWNVYELPYGVDFGVDFEKDRFRIYSEAQTGLYFGGVSAGSFLEFPKGEAPRLGLQSSLWVNAIIGLDIRARFSRAETRIAPGLYGKYMWTPGGNLIEKWEENHTEEGDDWGGGWDWD